MQDISVVLGECSGRRTPYLCYGLGLICYYVLMFGAGMLKSTKTEKVLNVMCLMRRSGGSQNNSFRRIRGCYTR